MKRPKTDKPTSEFVYHAPDSALPRTVLAPGNPALDFRGLNIQQKGDQFIIEKADDPNAIPMAAEALVDRLGLDHNTSHAPGDPRAIPMEKLLDGFEPTPHNTAHVLGVHGKNKSMVDIAKTMQTPVSITEAVRRDDAVGKVADFGHRYDDIRTQRATRHDDSVKRMLLNIARKPREIGLDETVDISSGNEKFVVVPKHDDRPLIDKLHEATFTEPVGLQWIEKKYDLRMLLRKAHCFTLDAVTSSLISDFSIAIAPDLESARRMAIPPFPVTWIDMDNRARLDRTRAMGIPLTDTAAGLVDGPPVERVGWLIRPAEVGGYYASYVTLFDEGVFYAPLSYWWHTEAPLDLLKPADVVDEATRRLAFGVANPNVTASNATLTPTPLEIKTIRRSDIDYMEELQGELRHIWGLLIALGAGQLGMEAKYSAQPKPTTVRTMKNGKPLLPLEHKVLHLHLARKMTPAKVVVRMTTHHKLRWHEVRAHFRTYRNKDGSVRGRGPVKAHERGDEKLGRVEKTYRVER